MKALCVVDMPGWAVDFCVDQLIGELPDIEWKKVYRDDVTRPVMAQLLQEHDIVYLANRDYGLPFEEEFRERQHPGVVVTFRSWRYQKRDVEWAVRHAAVVTAPCQSLAAELARHHKQVEYIPDAVDRRFHPSRAVRVGFAGTPHPPGYKGEHLVERAVAEFGGVLVKAVKEDGRIVSRDDMPKWYASVDCVVVASENEGFGLIVTEAMAMNVPVLTTCVGIAAELDCMYVPRSVPGIVRGLQRVFGRSQVLLKFAPEKVASQFNAVFQRLCGAPSNTAVLPQRTLPAASDFLEGVVEAIPQPSTNGQYSIALITPTIGRQSLRETIASGIEQLKPGDEWLIVGDGEQPEAKAIVDGFADPRLKYHEHACPGSQFGNAQRNFAMGRTAAKWVAFADDDDTLLPGALDAIRREAVHGVPLMFRMDYGPSDTVIWQPQSVRLGNVATPMFVVPNVREKLAKWANGSEPATSDFQFIRDTLALWRRGSLRWCEDVICSCKAHGRGKVKTDNGRDVLMVLEIQTAPLAMASLQALKIAQVWFGAEQDAAKQVNAFVRETEYRNCILVLGDAIVSQAALDAVQDALKLHPAATGWGCRDATSSVSTVTRAPLSTRDECSFYTCDEVRTMETPYVRTWLMSGLLTGCRRDVWARFPLRGGTEMGLSLDMQNAGVPLVAVRDAEVTRLYRPSQRGRVLTETYEPGVVLEKAG